MSNNIGHFPLNNYLLKFKGNLNADKDQNNQLECCKKQEACCSGNSSQPDLYTKTTDGKFNACC